MLGARTRPLWEQLQETLKLTYPNEIAIAFMPSSFDPVIVRLPAAEDMIQFGHLCQWRPGEFSQGVEEQSVDDHAGPERANIG